MDKALLAFAAELDDPSADLVIAALILSATNAAVTGSVRC